MFERETKPYGGPLLLTEVPAIFQQFRLVYAREGARFLQESLRAPGAGGPLRFLFPALVGNLSLDSVVFRNEGEHYIGLYAGGFLVMHDTFSTMLSHPKILDDIGDPSMEHFDGSLPPAFDLDVGHHPKLSTAIKRRFYRKCPRDPVRKAAALTMARLAFDFLFYHEIAHIIAGHLEFTDSSSPKAQLRERRTLHMADDDPSPMMGADILEYDADRIAAGYVWWLVSLGLDLSDTSEGGIRQQFDMFRALTFALGVLFRLFAQDTPGIHEHKAISHPHPDVRHILTAAVFLENAQKTSDETHIVIDGAFRRTTQDILDTWEILELPGPETPFDKESLDTLCIDTIHRLDGIQPKMSRLSHHSGITRWSTVLGRYV